jgi:uncharacterized protein YutE (UPF0331/DUF86 family)
MVDVDLIADKLRELDLRVARVRARRAGTALALAADRDAFELVAFNLMLAVQCCVDISLHVIADARWPVPRNAADAFDVLADHGILSGANAQRLRAAVGFRNVVAHGYAGVDPDKVHAAATAGLLDLAEFAQQLAAFAAPAPG